MQGEDCGSLPSIPPPQRPFIYCEVCSASPFDHTSWGSYLKHGENSRDALDSSAEKCQKSTKQFLGLQKISSLGLRVQNETKARRKGLLISVRLLPHSRSVSQRTPQPTDKQVPYQSENIHCQTWTTSLYLFRQWEYL